MPKLSGFYDPLYEYIAVDRQWRVDGQIDLLEFVNSLEFSRQMFLRQNGMGCFVFPSATHTRFAHALGACHLGFVAAERCRVHDSESGKILSFGEFLQRHDLTAAFSLSLLLHDIGHFAFSHTLESNAGLWSYLKGVHGVDRASHEEATCSLILGEGAFFQAAARRGRVFPRSVAQRAEHVHRVIRRAISKPERMENALCFLITGDLVYLNEFSACEVRQLKVVHELVSGLLDLDRIDHYRRDIYFNGLRPGTGVNYMSLLDGITVVYEDSSRNGNLILSGDAFGQAVALLQMKQRLSYDVFQNPGILANETMLNHAVSQYVRDAKLSADEVFDLLYSTDEELLLTLAQGQPAVSEIVHRMRARCPYAFVGRIDCTDWQRREANPSLLIEEIIRREVDEVESGLLFSLTGPWKRVIKQLAGLSGDIGVPMPGEEWLQHSRLEIDAERSQVIDQFNARQQLQALRSDHGRHLWLFRVDECDEMKRSHLLNSIKKRLFSPSSSS